MEPGESRLVGTHVLDEDEAATRTKHASELAQRARLVADSAEHEGGDGGVEAVVVEGKVFGRGAQSRYRPCVLADSALEPSQHWRFGLCNDERLDCRAVVGEVGPGAAADLEHPAGRVGEQTLAKGAEPRLFFRRAQPRRPCCMANRLAPTRLEAPIFP